MHRPLFLRICNEVQANNPYFTQRADACGVEGFTGVHKCVVAMRMLAYGSIADSLDDGYSMGESTVLQCVKEFTRSVIEVFEPEYLRPPNEEETKAILAENEARGFPGCSEASIACIGNGATVQHHGMVSIVDIKALPLSSLRPLLPKI